jgi:photosynthetic reaction center cytochrome c subunit
MLPKWFDDWNRERPADIYGPALLVGGLGAAVFFVIGIITLGQPFATNSMQTGPRGTGMHVAEFVNEVQTADPTIADMLTAADITPEMVAEVSDAALANVPPALEGIPEDRYAELVVAMRSWTGIPDLMEDPENYQTAVAYSMVEMVQNINENWIGHVQANAEVGVNCYTCHRGEAVPSEIWFRLGPVHARAAEGWSAVQNRVTMQSQFTSLPSDALEAYILNYEIVQVHDLEAHVDAYPDEGIQTWQHTERTYSFMNYWSNSLGVNCVFCHNSRAFYDAAQVTPQWATASLGLSMIQEMNELWLVPLEGVYPENRLGPVFADAPKAACKTCHKGYQQPLQGTNVIADWPELGAIEPDFAALAN